MKEVRKTENKQPEDGLRISKMKENSEYAITAPRGASKALREELRELGVESREEGALWLRAELSKEQASKIVLRSQIATRLLRLLAVAQSKEELLVAARKVRPEGSFAVRANGEERQVLEHEVGGAIKESSGAPVNLTKPDKTYLVIDCDDHYLLGADAAGDLSKRHYKIISGAQSLSGPVAAAALRLAGWTPRNDLLVWPCATGELAIEAALWASGKSPRAYELQNHDSKPPARRIVAADPRLALVSSAQKNAKIAGAHSYIRFSRQDLEWLDTKHSEKEISHIVGLLPNLREHKNFAKELFYQLDYILKTGGGASFLCVNEDSARLLEEGVGGAERKYLVSRCYLWAGKHSLTLVSVASQRAKSTKNS